MANGYEHADGCDLCEAARITPWYHEDDICWIAECEICAVPMVVWRGHGTEPPAGELEHMHTQLAAVVFYGALEEILTGWALGQLPGSATEVQRAVDEVVAVVHAGLAPGR